MISLITRINHRMHPTQFVAVVNWVRLIADQLYQTKWLIQSILKIYNLR